MLALVCLTREHNFRKKSLINYNIGCLKKARKYDGYLHYQPKLSDDAVLFDRSMC
jgi:hypothetical protein